MPISRLGAGLAVAAVSGLSVLALQAPASAAGGSGPHPECPRGKHYAPGNGCQPNGMSLNHRNFCPGEGATFKLFRYASNSGARGFIAGTGQPGTKYKADKFGNVRGGFTVPTKPGIYTWTVNGTATNGQSTSTSRTFQVYKKSNPKCTPATAVSTKTVSLDQPLGASTSNAELLALGGAGLLLLGTGPVVARRRRT